MGSARITRVTYVNADQDKVNKWISDIILKELVHRMTSSGISTTTISNFLYEANREEVEHAREEL